jgi:hypothetical protein
MCVGNWVQIFFAVLRHCVCGVFQCVEYSQVSRDQSEKQCHRGTVTNKELQNMSQFSRLVKIILKHTKRIFRMELKEK